MGGREEIHQPEIRKGFYRGDVTALCPVSTSNRHFLLAGTGPQVLLYDLVTGDLLCSNCVFDGVRVHGIISEPAFWEDKDAATTDITFESSTIIVHGERRVKLLKLIWCLKEKDPQLNILSCLPRFSHWVMDLRLLQETTSKTAGPEDMKLLAVGLSNNTICIWDLLNSFFVYRVECSEKCLLYSMRLWGDSLETLYAGAGTIFNEVLVWKLGPNQSAVRNTSKLLRELKKRDFYTQNAKGDSNIQDAVDDNVTEFVIVEEVVDPLQRIAGHEGSIHRLTWSSDGLSLVSVSDDRSARVWCTKWDQARNCDPWVAGVEPGPVLYGHGSRLWDCCFGAKLMVTASEDCTCRIWTAEGKHLATLKGHIGRGIWRCSYHPELNILITAGADSSIKVQSLDKWVTRSSTSEFVEDNEVSFQGKDLNYKLQTFSISPSWFNLNDAGSSGFLDSKSEYVRCLVLSSPWSLYIGTNQGAVYHVNLASSTDSSWTQLISDLEGPIVCMDVLVHGMIRGDGLGQVDNFPKDDMVVVGTGRGIASVIQVKRKAEQWHCERRHTWAAEMERQLLGVYWCKSIGGRYVFTTDPRGTWRMWRINERHVHSFGTTENISSDPSFNPNCITDSQGHHNYDEHQAELLAYGRGSHARIICIDVCPERQLLICGDKQGGLTTFSIPEDLLGSRGDFQRVLTDTEADAAMKLPIISVFKGAHGISAVLSVSVAPSKNDGQAEVISTGSDGCICRFLLNQHLACTTPTGSQSLICTGIEKVLALSMVEGLDSCKVAFSRKQNEKRVSFGFTGSDFLLWDLSHQCEVVRVMCGGWRRPHSVFIGDLPELQYCFVYVKDQVIQVQRNWTTPAGGGPCSSLEDAKLSERVFSSAVAKVKTQSLQGQFHGKEIYSVLFLRTTSDVTVLEGSKQSSWIATGSEDGRVLISRYDDEIGETIDSTLILGDHVGGSAVRALAFVTELHLLNIDEPLNLVSKFVECEQLFSKARCGTCGPQLLFSAGAKEVLTCWQIDWVHYSEGLAVSDGFCENLGKSPISLLQETGIPKHRMPSSQWLSTRIPSRICSSAAKTALPETEGTEVAEEAIDETLQANFEHRKEETTTCRQRVEDRDSDDDQRYLALTAFATKCMRTGNLISFVVTASSNATLHLHAFHVTLRSWDLIATLEYPTALVLAIEHLIAPFSSSVPGAHDVFMILTGAANGNFSLWDITKPVLEYCHSGGLNSNRDTVASLRPLTGRGSQGGRCRKKAQDKSTASDSLQLKHIEREPTKIDMADACIRGPPAETVSSKYAKTFNTKEGNRLPPFPTTQMSQRHAETNLTDPSVILVLNPLHELLAVHQSGINCISVARIERFENLSSSKIEMVYVMISGGDDQALHVAIFSLQAAESPSLCTSAEKSEGVFDCHGRAGRQTEEGIAGLKPPVLQYLSMSSVPCAHNSAVKGVWSDGFWAFTTGLDQRLRCWKLGVDVLESCSDSCDVDNSSKPRQNFSLIERATCITDVPEATSLHVEDCLKGLYQIAVVGRGLQVIKFNSNTGS